MLNVPAHWRIRPSFSELSPFGAGDAGRPLRIVVDSETVPASSALDLLRQFSRRPGVEVFATDDPALGHIGLGPIDTDRDLLPVTYATSDDRRETALFAASSWRDKARVSAAEHGLDENEVWRGLMLAQASRLHQIDALVSSAAVLRTREWSEHAQQAHATSAPGACALLGLFLRAHNDFTVNMDGNHATFVRFEDFYRGSASAALPDFPGWLAGAWAIRQVREDRRPFVMLRSVEARLARALIARDYIEVRIRHWRPDEAWDEALYFFESLLLSLAGAMDAVARALDAALQLNSNAWSIGFRKTNWRQAVADHSPRLGELMPQGSRLRSVVDAVAVLRNYIHEEVLSSEMLSDSGTPDIVDYGRGLLALSSTAADELYTATAEVGGAAAWGLEDHMGGGNTTVMPVLFERTAIRRVLEVIRELMATNLVPDAAPSVERPIDPGFWLPSARYGPHLRLLASLDDPPD